VQSYGKISTRNGNRGEISSTGKFLPLLPIFPDEIVKNGVGGQSGKFFLKNPFPPDEMGKNCTSSTPSPPPMHTKNDRQTKITPPATFFPSPQHPKTLTTVKRNSHHGGTKLSPR